MKLDSTLPRPLRYVYKAGRVAQLRLRNALSRRPLTGSTPVTVCVTSYGERLRVVGHAIESLGQGSSLPSRIILWVDDEEFDLKNYPMIRRQVRRGLEVRFTKNYGPHKKSYPFAAMTRGLEGPLATIDDDFLYPREWLTRLYIGSLEYPECFVGFRGHRMAWDAAGRLLPYAEWGPVKEGAAPSYAHFLTGGAGALFPSRLLQELADRGEEFMELCPRADDIWINVLAARVGLPGMVLNSRGLACIAYPRLQRHGLYLSNVHDGGNDLQLAATLTDADLERMRS